MRERRAYLRTVAALATGVTLAGCSGADGSDGDDGDDQR